MTANNEDRDPDFKLIFESVPGLFLVLRPDLTIIAASDAYLQATRTNRHEILGKGLFAVFPDNPSDSTADGVANLRASLHRVMQTFQPDVMPVQKYDIQLPVSEGGHFVERHWSPVNSPVFDANNNLVYIIHRVEDVTEFVNLQNDKMAREQMTDALRARAEIMESEIFQRSMDLSQMNKALIEEIERRKSVQAKLAEETDKLRRSNSDLLALQKSRDLLTGMIIHDLRNPLTGTLGYLDLIERRVMRNDEQTLRFAVNAKQCGLNMMNLINGIIDVMRMEDGKMPVSSDVVDIAQLASERAEHYHGAGAKEGLHLSYHGPSSLLCITDGTLIGRIIDNLIINAIKHTPSGGTVVVSVDQDPAHEEVRIQVQDSGEGISAHDCERLFQKYGRIETQHMRRSHDTGLGLLFCRMAVDLLGGRIAVTSDLGKGSVFTVTLCMTGRLQNAILQ